MVTLLEMTLTGSILVLAVLILRRLTLNRIPKTALVVMWMIIAVRLLLPVSFIHLFVSAGEKSPVIFSGAGNAMANAALTHALKIIWLAGAILCAAALCAAYAVSFKSFQHLAETENEFIRSFQQSDGLKRTVRIKISERTTTPFTYGIFHPVILLPAGLNLENRKQMDYILKHEYIHIRKFDNLLKGISNIAVCVHWFNPFAWAMRRYLSQDLELRCDEILLKESDGDCRADYANTLIDMEEQRRYFGETDGMADGLGSGFTDDASLERIRAIMKYRPAPFLLKFLSVTAFLIAAAAAILAVTRSITQWQGSLLADGALLFGQITLPVLVCILAAYLTYRHLRHLHGKKQFSTMVILSMIYGTTLYIVWEMLTRVRYAAGAGIIYLKFPWNIVPSVGHLLAVRLTELLLFGFAAACTSAWACRREARKEYPLGSAVSLLCILFALALAVTLLYLNMAMTGVVYGVVG